MQSQASSSVIIKDRKSITLIFLLFDLRTLPTEIGDFERFFYYFRLPILIFEQVHFIVVGNTVGFAEFMVMKRIDSILG